MGNIFPSPLNDIISVVGVSSVDGKAAALCEGLKRISLLCELPIGYSFDLEPTARMLAGVSFWHSSVLVVVVIDAETGIECLHNKGVFVPLTHDREALGRVVCEGVDDESMVVRGDRQSFGGVLKGDDAVVGVRLSDKVLRKLRGLGDLDNLWIANLVCGYDVPHLMGCIFPVPLDDVGAVVGCASEDGKALSLGESFDGVALCGLFEFEPATRVLPRVRPQLSSILLFVLAYAQPRVVGLHHKGELLSLCIDGEALRGIVCEGVNDETLVEGRHSQSLLRILCRNNAVVNVGLRHKALSDLEVSKTLHKQKYQQDISQ